MMGILDFGRRLIETEDLDPVYVAVYKARLEREHLCRFLLAYWCFYHMGAAAYISEREGKHFWNAMTKAAKNEQPSPLGERWPRASERRYFRGPKCVAAVEFFAKEKPEYWVSSLRDLRTERQVIEHVREQWPLFGPWIGFKIADMMERVVGSDVSFSNDIGLVYESPRAGLQLAIDKPSLSDLHGSHTRGDAYERLRKFFSTYRAPPGRDRPCGPQEVETVLCKWKSHAEGRYNVGKDIAEIRHALSGGWGETADKLLRASPKLIGESK